MTESPLVCWCGNGELRPFGPDYVECRACGTLVFAQAVAAESLLADRNDTGFYGKEYWLSHQQVDLGSGDIHVRARSDLSERNLHWLETLLALRPPPASLLELGCSHGSFIALTRLAGYESSGVEISPWVVDFGRSTFGVPVLVGPIENLDLPAGSLDLVVLMDVLEHLPAPLETMSHCLELLKPDGIMLIQTPQFREGMTFESLMENRSRFLEMLIPVEHLHLFSERSATCLFRQLGADYIRFEPAIFADYDMFFAVSRVPLWRRSVEEVDRCLSGTPSGRLVQAMLDLRRHGLEVLARNAELERISASLDEQVRMLACQLRGSDIDRAARGEQIKTLTAMVHEVEDDRAARGKQIETLTAMLKESEADRDARAVQIEELTALIRRLEQAPGGRG